MIELTKLNEQKVLLNPDLIEYVIANPDTVITLINGNKFVVKESLTEVIDKVIEYRSKIQQRALRGKLAEDEEKD